MFIGGCLFYGEVWVKTGDNSRLHLAGYGFTVECWKNNMPVAAWHKSQIHIIICCSATSCCEDYAHKQKPASENKTMLGLKLWSSSGTSEKEVNQTEQLSK